MRARSPRTAGDDARIAKTAPATRCRSRCAVPARVIGGPALRRHEGRRNSASDRHAAAASNAIRERIARARDACWRAERGKPLVHDCNATHTDASICWSADRRAFAKWQPGSCDVRPHFRHANVRGTASESMRPFFSDTVRIRRETHVGTHAVHSESCFDSTRFLWRKARSFGGRASSERSTRRPSNACVEQWAMPIDAAVNMRGICFGTLTAGVAAGLHAMADIRVAYCHDRRM